MGAGLVCRNLPRQDAHGHNYFYLRRALQVEFSLLKSYMDFSRAYRDQHFHQPVAAILHALAVAVDVSEPPYHRNQYKGIWSFDMVDLSRSDGYAPSPLLRTYHGLSRQIERIAPEFLYFIVPVLVSNTGAHCSADSFHNEQMDSERFSNL